MFSLYLTGDENKDRDIVLEYAEASLLKGSDVFSFIADLSNVSALLFWFLKDINWIGFYLVRGETLVLGPFQGEPACSTIPFSKGVCGKCAREERTIIVPDVEKFPGHIACSSLSRSEIVIPLFKDGRLWGVMDTDSPRVERFGEEDRAFLEKVCSLISPLYPELLKELGKRE